MAQVQVTVHQVPIHKCHSTAVGRHLPVRSTGLKIPDAGHQAASIRVWALLVPAMAKDHHPAHEARCLLQAPISSEKVHLPQAVVLSKEIAGSTKELFICAVWTRFKAQRVCKGSFAESHGPLQRSHMKLIGLHVLRPSSRSGIRLRWRLALSIIISSFSVVLG